MGGTQTSEVRMTAARGELHAIKSYYRPLVNPTINAFKILIPPN